MVQDDFLWTFQWKIQHLICLKCHMSLIFFFFQHLGISNVLFFLGIQTFLFYGGYIDNAVHELSVNKSNNSFDSLQISSKIFHKAINGTYPIEYYTSGRHKVIISFKNLWECKIDYIVTMTLHFYLLLLFEWTIQKLLCTVLTIFILQLLAKPSKWW